MDMSHMRVEHLVMRCTSVVGEREKLVRLMREMVAEWQSMDDSDRVTTVLDYECKNGEVGRFVEMIWRKWFVAGA